MNLTVFFLAFSSFGLVPASSVSLTEDVVPAAATLLPLNRVSLGRDQLYALHKRAGNEQKLPPPASLALTKPESSRRGFSWSNLFRGKPTKPTKLQINWSDDYSTNLVRKWPVLFLPWGSKDKQYDTHVCEVLDGLGCKQGNAKIELERHPGQNRSPGPAFTTVTDLKPKNKKFSEVYISRDGRVRFTHPETPPPPKELEKWRKQELEKEYKEVWAIAHPRLAAATSPPKGRAWPVPSRKQMSMWRAADQALVRYGPTKRQMREASYKLDHWEDHERARERERDFMWAEQRWDENQSLNLEPAPTGQQSAPPRRGRPLRGRP